VALGDAAGYEAARIEAGVPVMGRELTGKTIPQEAGLVPRAVSLTKGCYTGQELVARLDARGNRVARRLVGFTVTSGSPAAGDTVVVEGRVVGSVTSVAYSPRTGGCVALGYLRRSVATPAVVEIVHDGSPCAAQAAELPLWHDQGTPRAC
jgi:folate-binding protein YgfZ